MRMNEERENRRLDKNKDIRALVTKADKICLSFFKENYTYSDAEAIAELGVDEELLHQLVEDFVSQIIRSVIKFEHLIYQLQENVDAKKELDFTEFRDLAHKNLGVARNLRIKDAEILLNSLMTEDDLEYLFRCIEALQSCAVRLKPVCAYNTIKIIKVKSSF